MSQGVALVTGCSSGFGLLASVTLAKSGFSVVATMRNLGKRDRLDAALGQAGVEATVLALDVTNAESISAAVAEVEQKVGPVDVLVNNAGYGVGGFFYDLTIDEIRRQFETNYFGALAMVKAVLPGMVERRRGRIINISSIGGRVALPVMAAYCSTKFALEAFSESLRAELKPFGIWVVLVEPGTFRTDIFDANRQTAASGQDESSPFYRMSRRMEELVEKMLAKNRQDPQWVADAISDAATTPRPRLRYLVGRDAKLQAGLKRLSPGGLERVIEWQTQLSKHLPEGGG